MAKEIAQSIRSEVQRNVGQPGSGDIVYMGADRDSTYRIDDVAEKAAIQTLEGEPVALLSEEAGFVMLHKKPRFICVLDPLDGSTNAVTGIPFYCASVAFAPWSWKARLTEITAGVVLNLVTGDLFEAEKNGGARLNGKTIKSSQKTSLAKSTAALYLKSNYNIVPLFSKVRGMGAVALELAHLAAGGLDLFLDNRNHLKVTDVAAAKLIINEAGGVVTDLKAKNLNGNITKLERVSVMAAGNRALHEKLLSEVKQG